MTPQDRLDAKRFNAKPSYVAGLDGLRAAAVITVFLGHTFPAMFANSVGVDIFFALSGFLITRGLAEQLRSSGKVNLAAFYTRRVLRLAPALVLMIGSFLVVAAVVTLVLDDHSLRAQILASIISLAYLMNWSRAFHHGPSGWLGHTWSLSIEEQFYLLWPLILAVAFRWGGAKGALRCAGIIGLLSVLLRIYLYYSGATEDRIYNGFDTRADSLLIGCSLALSRPLAVSTWAGRLCLVPVAAIGWVFIFVPWLALGTLSSPIVAGASAWLILVLWARASPRLAKVFEFPPLRYVGRISYGLYLWHWPVLGVLWEFNFPNNSVETAALAGAITLPFAAASFHFVEQPVLRLKERIELSGPRRTLRASIGVIARIVSAPGVFEPGKPAAVTRHISAAGSGHVEQQRPDQE